jgi:hypothetical protein
MPLKLFVIWIAAIALLPLSLIAQDSSVILMDQEPHHHLVLQNNLVKVFNVQVSPGDSIILHRHEQDTIAIAIGDQLVTVGIPGKPDVHQKNADAQIRLQRGGYMHSTRVDGNTPYHTIAVELMRVQTDFHNLCAEVLPGQPLNCPDVPAMAGAKFASQPLVESRETRARLVRVLPHQSMTLMGFPASQLMVALDAAAISGKSPKDPEQTLQPGDFVWMDTTSGSRRIYQNHGEKETRFIQILFAPE